MPCHSTGNPFRGECVDDGTAFELGVAFARGVPPVRNLQSIESRVVQRFQRAHCPAFALHFYYRREIVQRRPQILLGLGLYRTPCGGGHPAA